MNDFFSSYESLYSLIKLRTLESSRCTMRIAFFRFVFRVYKMSYNISVSWKIAALGKVKSYALILHIIFGVMPKESYAYRITIMEELHIFFYDNFFSTVFTAAAAHTHTTHIS